MAPPSSPGRRRPADPLMARQRDRLAVRRGRAEALRAAQGALVAADDDQRQALAGTIHGRFQGHMVVAEAYIRDAAAAATPAAQARALAEAVVVLAGLQEASLATIARLVPAARSPGCCAPARPCNAPASGAATR